MKNTETIHSAIQSNNNELAKKIIQNTRHIDILNTWEMGVPPLILAIDRGNTEIAKALIEKGASLTITDYKGNTPLHVACMKSNREVANNLMNNKTVNINQKNDAEYTPLHLAIYYGMPDVALNLIKKGAKVDIEDKGIRWSGESKPPNQPIFMSIDKGQTDVSLAIINKGIQIDLVSKNDDTPLHRSIATGNNDIALALINNGADINTNPRVRDSDGLYKNTYGNTPLHLAIYKENNYIANTLIDLGAELDTKACDDYNPFT